MNFFYFSKHIAYIIGCFGFDFLVLPNFIIGKLYKSVIVMTYIKETFIKKINSQFVKNKKKKNQKFERRNRKFEHFQRSEYKQCQGWGFKVT